ncbi:MAG: TonB-dependent receptor [Cyclobacteriaceae bacterium]|nr:TonB-dependent receptor [Cyclobacteriaceae bacterium]
MKNKYLHQILKLMRLGLYAFFITAISFNLLIANSGSAQIAPNVKDVTISLQVRELSLSQVFNLIEKKTDYRFSYDNINLDPNTKVSLNIRRASVRDILYELSRETDLSFRQVNWVINVKDIDRVEAKNDENLITFEQAITVTGHVTASDSPEGLPGVNVLIRGTNTGSVTDISGNYSINVTSPETVLTFSSVGYLTETITVGNRNVIDVSLTADVTALDEIVVVGYGTVKKSDLTGSVASVRADEINAFPTTNVMQALSGRAAGVQIIQNTGAPGSPVSVRIRGTNSIIGGNEPLYVIDGFPFSGSPTNLNNFDIESIEVLKDASATAIYGSRGANGVVLITTKQGKKGMTRVDFESTYSVQSLRRKLDLMNGTEYARLQNIQAANDNIPLYFTEQEVNAFGEGYDWQDLVFQQAPMYTSNLNISGGNDKTQFSISGSIFGQEGIIRGSDYNRYNLRTNITHAISKKVKVDYNTTLTSLKTERRDSGGGNRGNSMIGSAISAAPISRPFNDDGTYNILANEFPFVAVDVINPLNFINEELNKVNANVVLSNLAFVYQPIEDLTIRISGGIENRDDRSDSYRTRNFWNSPGNASINTTQFRSLLNENTISYNKTIANRHQINSVIGFTFQDFLRTGLNAGGVGFLSDAFETHQLQAAATHGIPGSSYNYSVLLSYLGRINYTLDNKYLFTFSFRSDGSSIFSEGNKYGYFPSGAFAWRVSDESFMSTSSFISDLKLRASWGLTGSQAISPYATLNQLSSGNTIFGGQLFNTFAPSAVLPGDLRWETTEQIDIGFDLSILDNRISFNADYYVKNTRDLLNNVLLPTSMGFTRTIQNIGQVQNSGLELSTDAKIFTNQFQWNVFGNISFNRNKVISLHNGEDILGTFVNVLVVGDNTTILREGRPIGQFWGYVEDGYTEQGRINFADLNNDGVINELDKTYIGDPNPNFIYGFNSFMSYKNFEFSFFIQGMYGNDIFNVSAIPSTLDFGQGLNMPREVLYNHWTPENPNAKYPRVSRNTAARVSDRFIEDGSFLRFRNIEIAYNLPMEKLGSRSISNAKIFLSAQNLITITNYSWWDPEVNSRGAGSPGIDHYSYPVPRALTMGFRVGF